MSDYDTDILTWSERQAELLRRRAAGEPVNEADLDWPNIAEEIESLGKTVARELASRVSTILVHLIKLEASPVAELRIGWRTTIREQRDEIDLLLEDAPSMRPTIAALIGRRVDKAKEHVRRNLTDYGEQPHVDIDRLTFTEDQVLGEWLPKDPT